MYKRLGPVWVRRSKYPLLYIILRNDVCIFVFALLVVLKEILKTPSALGRFHSDLGFMGTGVNNAGDGSFWGQRFGPDDVLIVSFPLEQFPRNCSTRGSIYIGLS